MKRELTTTYINWLKELYEVCIHSLKCLRISLGFPGSSVGGESTCNAGDPGSIPGLGRSVGEGIDHPLQYSWASLVVQLVKNLPAMQEIWVQSLGREDPLEKEMATHPRFLPGKSLGQGSLVGYSPWDCGRVGHDSATKQESTCSSS